MNLWRWEEHLLGKCGLEVVPAGKLDIFHAADDICRAEPFGIGQEITPRSRQRRVADGSDFFQRDSLGQQPNRQRGSGTRALLDWELAKEGIKPQDILGYENEEYTHMNVAAAVLSGRADVGLGIKSAAVALGLEFIPVGVEEYDLIIPSVYWEDGRIRALLDVIRAQPFISAVQRLGGYGTDHTGTLLWTR